MTQNIIQQTDTNWSQPSFSVKNWLPVHNQQIGCDTNGYEAALPGTDKRKHFFTQFKFNVDFMATKHDGC